jgi:hypothetical protein
MPDTAQTVHVVGNVQMDVVAGLVLLTEYFSLPASGPSGVVATGPSGER